ncbi:fluoride efflux transporter FluC [Lysinibacillus pakistanensis]|uniref:Fluoride-specific ion channel FluC n=1 Tax=Lysinibacillus pakistanensis TaxID=759811 RepID=A0AAX3WNZ6_9BACI|nr:CrcB family protein [Lysinibacillus pakistanensis]MDM5233949.1 CrcB family protein [Lysinibacillus pakistanensis]QGG51936.1 fluoride efflux transporter CrcB [Lysinibacillus pakistanensis]WHY44557.1 CrcB family protein [Lysinibacillus pakistanensis]WHY49565.1 CrcB family protein [Lysinibacillus pakistanensis]
MILIGIGGFLGALTRFYLGKWIVHTYPWTTFFINITGSFALGVLFALHLSDWLWHFIGIGFLGAYTTFSTFGFESLQLVEQKKWSHAIIYMSSSILLGILCATLGFYMV